MKITQLSIENFKSVEELVIRDIEDVLILVGRNNAGKSVMLDAIRAVSGDYAISEADFHHRDGNITIGIQLLITDEDLEYLHQNGIVGNFKQFSLWKENFCKKLPSYQETEDGGTLEFEYIYGRNGIVRYKDGYFKNNRYIKSIFPKIYFVDQYRDKEDISQDLILLQQDTGLQALRDDRCIFDEKRKCHQCFECIGVIQKKTPEQLTLMETSRLLQYKLFTCNLNRLSERLNYYFSRNGGQSHEIHYEIKFDADELFKIDTVVRMRGSKKEGGLDALGEGLKSIYILSLLQTYVDTKNTAPYIIMVDTPEIYLHPQLKKVASEILYRLSKKNQVIFSTHEPEMLFNFTSGQIRQVYSDSRYNTCVREDTDLDAILNDLGYTANDLMNVSFVFIVEGKQDKSRLPLLLKKYYSEVYDESGQLKRIAIISTNSCTNIKTYANLKYINSVYLKDSFMMIRDSDGKNRMQLGQQLCKYYGDRSHEDKGNLPRVTEKNVLILKYYSFENYFLFPEVMAQIGVVKSVDAFYDILWSKYQEYLYKLTSVKAMLKKTGIKIQSRQDIVDNIENIRIYVRGHNLYDIFYGRYKKQENEILTKYIEAAPREIFADILEKIDAFVYFDSRKKEE